ncbi:MAG: response regulator transcription factor [bacterium]|uniref:Response regulator transcription factor n=1 Tax=Candidatus Aphodosoma intestinipullorum TaxID=2840674 RepID=A0A940IEK5_9BACT|nr:response regulator transcription factor [Candidatus Aphodosoma intestinipullorum]
MKVLIVEDEPSLREIIRKALQNERLVVEEAADFATACEKTGLYDYECILLDIMLPDGNGLELLQRLKKEGKRDRVIIISAKDSIEDKVKGLDLGADDYLAKPFHIAELTARVKSLIRRNNNGSNAVTLGNVTLDNTTFRVEAGGTPIELNRKEFDILRYFMHRPNHMISKETLAEAVWGDNIDQADNFDFIYAQIKNLRKKLQQAGATIEIKAVYGFGYKLVEL